MFETSFKKRMQQRARASLELQAVFEILQHVGKNHEIERVSSLSPEGNINLDYFAAAFPRFPMCIVLASPKFDSNFLGILLMGPAKHNPLFQELLTHPLGKAALRGDEQMCVLNMHQTGKFQAFHNLACWPRSRPADTRMEFGHYGRRKIKFAYEFLTDLLADIPGSWCDANASE